MNDTKKRRYRTGKEVLEHFVPGYRAEKKSQDDTAVKPKELKEKLLARLREKLETLDITNSHGEAESDLPNSSKLESA
jgi:hypothetical protein